MLALLILILSPPVLCYDNCGGNKYLCGDLCIIHSDLCICGNITLTISSQEYCCSSQPCTLGPVQYTGFATQRTGTCKTGKPTMLSKTCQGQCNYHPDYQDRNEFTGASETGYHSRSYFPCESGDQCVPEDALCGGVALCHNKSDLKMCEDLNCIFPMLPCSANNSSKNNTSGSFATTLSSRALKQIKCSIPLISWDLVCYGKDEKLKKLTLIIKSTSLTMLTTETMLTLFTI